MRRIVAIALMAALAGSAPLPALGADELAPEDVARADAERRAVARRLVETTAEYEQAIVAAETLQEELSQLGRELGAREAEISVTRLAAAVIVRKSYVTGGDRGLLQLFDAGSISELSMRSSYLERITAGDTATLRRLEALRSSYVSQQARIESVVAEQAHVTATLDLLASRILEELDAANEAHAAVASAYARQEAEKRAREEAERKAREEARRREAEEAARAATTTTTGTTDPPGAATTAPPGNATTTSAPPATEATTTTTTPPPPPPPVTDGRTCPVAGAVSFVDSWGAPRSGGRRHQGVDMIASRGTPVVAIESGTVFRTGNGGLGGITVWLRGQSGDEYYYAHLDAWAAGLSTGSSVGVGDPLGSVGNTGNARYTITHLHFEHHPGGGSAVNPYPLAANLCL